MKTQSIKITTLLALAFLFYSCEKEELAPAENQSEHTAETKSLVELRTQIDNATFKLFGDELNGSSNGKVGVNHRFSGLFNSAKNGRITEELDSCAHITLTGSGAMWTLVVDYGDGCVSDSLFRTGKVTLTGYDHDSTGMIDITFENFYEIPSTVAVEVPQTMSGNYKATYNAYASGEYNYIETFEGAITVDHKDGKQETLNAVGELFANATGIKVTKYNFNGSNGEGDTFSGETVDPLFYDFSCTESSIYVSGAEHYRFNEHQATVDFGDGACDNIFTIYTDGITIIVDLDEAGT